MKNNQDILDAIIELQSIAQAGLYYGHDRFDHERYQRIRDITAEILSFYIDHPIEQIQDVFCHESGYQTPKIDTRAAIFNEKNQILLVQETDGLWSLPGGWVDMNMSIRENTEKEVLEEAGLVVNASQIIAIMDRDKHNLPRYLYKVIKVFVMCEVENGQFQENLETVASSYFSFNDLPDLSTAKNNNQQIQMCFEAHTNKDWKTFFD